MRARGDSSGYPLWDMSYQAGVPYRIAAAAKKMQLSTTVEIFLKDSCVHRPHSWRAWQHGIAALIVTLATSACGTLPLNPVPID